MLKKSSSIVLASLKGSTHRSIRLASSLAAALLDSLFEHPARGSPVVLYVRSIEFLPCHNSFSADSQCSSSATGKRRSQDRMFGDSAVSRTTNDEGRRAFLRRLARGRIVRGLSAVSGRLHEYRSTNPPRHRARTDAAREIRLRPGPLQPLA